MTVPEQTRSKGGRRTREEEVARWVASLDLDEATREAILTADPRAIPEPAAEPLTAEQMRDRALTEVYAEFSTLRGIAKVQALKQFIEATRGLPKPEPPTPEPLIADIVGGQANLPASRVREILAAERVRMLAELAAIDEALAKLEAAA